MGVLASIQQAQILEGFLLQRYQYASYDLLPLNGIVLQAIGHHVVDILHKDNVSLNLVQVLNQSTVSTWTEQQRTV